MLHIPILRHGRPYESLDVARVPHHATREPFVEISQANLGLIRRDLLDQASARRALAKLTCAELLDICARASEHFAQDTLPLGDQMQSPDQYIAQLSATTGLPYRLGRRNMEKIRGVMAQMKNMLGGLTRNLDFAILDSGFGEAHGSALSYVARTDSLGVVLPSNSPGVHSLWVPAIALKIPLVLKPGGAEPWTPYRILQALMRAGCPPEACGYYPADHSGAAEILRRCGRGIVFGDTSTTAAWQNDSRIEIHGPGYSKIVFDQGSADTWEQDLDVLVTSVSENSGRSCVNASGIWTPARADDIAEALAERLARVTPRAADDEQAELAPFADAATAARISQIIDNGLKEPGARDVTAGYRRGPRLVQWQGSTYLLPTVLRCAPEHPLANREFLFPFVSVVEVPQQAMPECLGPSLVVTAIISDPALERRLVESPLIDRLNLGPISTLQISWDQPHEGNLFEHLYARRSFQKAVAGR